MSSIDLFAGTYYEDLGYNLIVNAGTSVEEARQMLQEALNGLTAYSIKKNCESKNEGATKVAYDKLSNSALKDSFDKYFLETFDNLVKIDDVYKDFFNIKESEKTENQPEVDETEKQIEEKSNNRKINYVPIFSEKSAARKVAFRKVASTLGISSGIGVGIGVFSVTALALGGAMAATIGFVAPTAALVTLVSKGIVSKLQKGDKAVKKTSGFRIKRSTEEMIELENEINELLYHSEKSNRYDLLIAKKRLESKKKFLKSQLDILTNQKYNPIKMRITNHYTNIIRKIDREIESIEGVLSNERKNSKRQIPVNLTYQKNKSDYRGAQLNDLNREYGAKSTAIDKRKKEVKNTDKGKQAKEAIKNLKVNMNLIKRKRIVSALWFKLIKSNKFVVKRSLEQSTSSMGGRRI